MRKIFLAILLLFISASIFPNTALSAPAGINGYEVIFFEDEDGVSDWYWSRDGKSLDEVSLNYGVYLNEITDTFIIWLAVDPNQESMKDSERGIIFRAGIKNELNYYFLPYENHVYEINFNEENNHINIIWGDDPKKVFEKGFKFPSFEDEGSNNVPTQLGAVG